MDAGSEEYERVVVEQFTRQDSVRQKLIRILRIEPDWSATGEMPERYVNIPRFFATAFR